MTIRSAVLIGCQRVTDGRTDGQTDGRTDVQPISITCFCIADARKNYSSRSPHGASMDGLNSTEKNRIIKNLLR